MTAAGGVHPAGDEPLIAGSGGQIRFGEGALSHGELLETAAGFAAELGDHEVIAVWAAPALPTVVAFLGAAMRGAVAVPLAPDLGVVERDHVLRHSGAAAVVGAPASVHVPLPRLDVAMGHRLGSVPSIAVSDDVALILYTSGTTGPPKGVPITRRALACNLDALAECWAWTRDDTVVHALPLFHVHGLVLGVLGVLRCGGSLHHVGAGGTAALAGAVAAAPSAVMFGVPTHYARILRDPTAAGLLHRARLLVSGSAPLPPTVSDGVLAACGQRPRERYGSTETLICTAARASDEPRAGYVGPAVPGVQLRLANAAGEPVPGNDTDTGEVQVRGPSVFAGYLGDAAGTEAAFADGWYRTGDIGALAPDGNLRLLGRAASEVLKCGGFKISALEIEATLLSHPQVAQAAVVGVADDELGERPVAYVVAAGVGEQELIDHVAGQLAVHKRPRAVVFLDDLPRNAMGKVQKHLLGS